MEKAETMRAVKSVRLALGDTQQDFAFRLRTAVRTIARWEKDRAPSGASLVQLAKLASDNNLRDAAMVFQAAFAHENGLEYFGKDMRTRSIWRSANNVEAPTSDDERKVVAEALCLYRNREFLPQWSARDAASLRDLEMLATMSEQGRPIHTDSETLRDILAWARSRHEPRVVPSALIGDFPPLERAGEEAKENGSGKPKSKGKRK